MEVLTMTHLLLAGTGLGGCLFVLRGGRGKVLGIKVYFGIWVWV